MLSNNAEINNILNNINMLHVDTYDNNNNFIKKGRGRPRKEIIVENQISETYEPKKRGRKPKENKPIINKSIMKNEEIVLHLSNINSSDLSKHGIFIQNTKNDNSEANDNLNDNNIFTIGDSDNDDNTSFSEERNELLLKIKSMTEQINNLENKLKENNSNNQPNFIIDKHTVRKMSVNLINYINGDSIILEPTNISCWWCTEPFSTLPCFNVRDKKNGSYVVFGCFCSYNCAVTFNLNMDDYKMWDRHSLIKQLYNDITSTTDNIQPAPPRETLKKFGGHLTIEEFRKNSKIITKEYRCLMPPMIPIVPFIEENNKNIKKNIQDMGFINNCSSKNDDLVLKRTKPLPGSKNNLANAFNFKKKN